MDAGEDVAHALRREVGEELGITDFQEEFLGKYIFEGKRERELVYVYRCVYDGEVKPNEEELDGGRFFTLDEIRQKIGKDFLTPNFEDEFTKFFGS